MPTACGRRAEHTPRPPPCMGGPRGRGWSQYVSASESPAGAPGWRSPRWPGGRGPWWAGTWWAASEPGPARPQAGAPWPRDPAATTLGRGECTHWGFRRRQLDFSCSEREVGNTSRCLVGQGLPGRYRVTWSNQMSEPICVGESGRPRVPRGVTELLRYTMTAHPRPGSVWRRPRRREPVAGPACSGRGRPRL